MQSEVWKPNPMCPQALASEFYIPMLPLPMLQKAFFVVWLQHFGFVGGHAAPKNLLLKESAENVEKCIFVCSGV